MIKVRGFSWKTTSHKCKIKQAFMGSGLPWKYLWKSFYLEMKGKSYDLNYMQFKVLHSYTRKCIWHWIKFIANFFFHIHYVWILLQSGKVTFLSTLRKLIKKLCNLTLSWINYLICAIKQIEGWAFCIGILSHKTKTVYFIKIKVSGVSFNDHHF